MKVLATSHTMQVDRRRLAGWAGSVSLPARRRDAAAPAAGTAAVLLLRASRFTALITLLALPLAAQTRLASDFEIAQMEKQLATSRGFEAQLSGRLNLGDARASRNELSLARAEYAKALTLADRERLGARRDSSLGRYANATGYAALAQAKLGRTSESFALLEEAARYASDDPETWSLYASAMRILGHPRKSVSAARNAVAIAARKENRLDLAIYQHTLASALIEAGEDDEAERLLVSVIAALRSTRFDALKRDVARQESFEVYSSARGDVAAYVSLLNRAQLRLAALYERRGQPDRARAQYERVLEGRNDDATALAGVARLAKSDGERERRYAEAFDANPFSTALVREYQRYLRSASAPPAEGNGPGPQMRIALAQLARGEHRAARATLDALLEKFPDNETLRTLRREAEGATIAVLPSSTPTPSELRALLDTFERLTPEQRAQLDRTTYMSVARFTGTTFESGTIDGVPFRFSEPTTFEGTFDVTKPLRLTYRILGVTRAGDTDALLLEPVRLEQQ
jgi:tetratricopeptide repeat protein